MRPQKPYTNIYLMSQGLSSKSVCIATPFYYPKMLIWPEKHKELKKPKTGLCIPGGEKSLFIWTHFFHSVFFLNA